MSIEVDTLKDLSIKNKQFLEMSSDIDTLILGSSHGDYSFNPRFFDKSFNFCSASQDFSHSVLLYDYLSEFGASLKRIIFFCSIFTPLFELALSSEKLRCLAFYKVFGNKFPLPPDFSDGNINLIETGASAAINVGKYYRGFNESNNKLFFPAGFDVKKRAMSHLKYFDVGALKKCLEVFSKKCLDNHHELIVVIPPIRSDYKFYVLKEYKQMIEGIVNYRLENSGIKNVVDLFSDIEIQDSYFGDSDHLYPMGPGPQIVVEKIRKKI